MVDKTKLEELKIQIGLVWDIMRHTDVKDPRQAQLRELLATMYQELNRLEPHKNRLDKPLLSEDSL